MRKTFTYKGKRYSVQRKTEEELDRAIELKKKQLDTGKFSAFAWDWYRTFKEPYVGKATQSMYKASIKTCCMYIGNKYVHDITASDVQKMITAEMSSKSKTDKLILTVRQILRHADIDLNIVRPQFKENRHRALTQCEERVIVEACHKSKYGLWILTMLYLGLRPSETALLRYSDIQNGYIHVRGTKSSKSDRFIPLPEALISDLSGFYGDKHIFITSAGNPLKKQSIDRWWRFFKRDLDLYMGAPTYRNKIIESYISPDITLYTLRHTFGTRAQQHGIPIDVLADLMGHEKIETTRKYYISDNFESKELCRAKLNEMWT